MQTAATSQKRFGIALTFPGDHRRKFVHDVAVLLAKHVGAKRVLYDEFHEADFARLDFDTYLQLLYHEESELIALFLSAEYASREWCRLEWRAIRDLIKQRRGSSVMPLRFDATEIPGLFSTDGYVWIGDRKPEEIADLILQRYRALSDASTPEVPQLGLHGVPPAPPHFVGRGELLEELSGLARGGGDRVFGITGMPGVGKTSLMRKLAELLGADFPDAQFLIDLKGDTSQPIPAKTVMHNIAHSLNSNRRPALSEEVQQNFYLDELHGRRVLVILDNVRSADQVRPLIPKQGCFLLATSRWTLAGLDQKKLETLSRGDAVMLLTDISPRLRQEEPTTVDRLAELCGDLPLALRAVGCTLQKRVSLSLTEYLRRLEQTGRNPLLDEIDPERRSTAAALQSSYDLLDEELSRCFRLTGVFPDHFGVEAARAVWEVGPEQAKLGLEELLSYGLIEFNGRWRLHDLIRVFADRRMTLVEREAVHRRHAQYFLEVLEDTQRLHSRGERLRADTSKRLSEEWLNIQAGQAWVAKHTAEDDRAAKWCWRYAYDPSVCLSAHLYGAECIRWREDALAAAKKLGDVDWQAHALSTLGWAYKDFGRYPPAVECQQAHLEMARAHGRRDWECEALFALALAHQAQGEYDLTIKLLQQRLQLAIELKSLRHQSSAYGGLGNVYCEQRKYDLALECHTKRLEIDRQLGTPAGHALWGLGLTLHKLGKNDAAKVHLEESLKISREIGDLVAEHTAFGILGDVYFSEQNFQLARDYHANRAEIARKIGDLLGEALGLYGASRAKYELAQSPQDLEAAIVQAEGALAILEGIRAPEAGKVHETVQEWRAAGGQRVQGDKA